MGGGVAGCRGVYHRLFGAPAFCFRGVAPASALSRRELEAGPFNRHPNISISVKLLMDLRTEHIEKLSQLS